MRVYSGSMHHFQYTVDSNSVKLKLFVHYTFESMMNCLLVCYGAKIFLFSVIAWYACMAGD